MHALLHRWRSGVVVRGDQLGRTLNFPTVNFDPALAADVEREGIYASEVKIDGALHLGALYFAPRLTLGETKRVLEIHILDFEGDLYGKTLTFRFGPYIRPAANFASEVELKTQLADDALAARRLLARLD